MTQWSRSMTRMQRQLEKLKLIKQEKLPEVFEQISDAEFLRGLKTGSF